MSIRQSPVAGTPVSMDAHKLRADIETMRHAQALSEVTTEQPIDASVAFEQLTETEKSAASIGVSPDDWKPIGALPAIPPLGLLCSQDAVSQAG